MSARHLPRLSFGVGDRFAHQAEAQLAAFERLAAAGVVVTPVWNKSHREHTLIGSAPESVREAAARAVAARRWPHPWFVDADHVRLDTVDRFLGSSDFFTIDVADAIGGSVTAADPMLAGKASAPLQSAGVGNGAEYARTHVSFTISARSKPILFKTESAVAPRFESVACASSVWTHLNHG